MVGNGGHVGGHRAERIGEARAVLNTETTDRVRIIARPYLRHKRENAGIKSSAATRTTLEKNVRELAVETAHDFIKPKDKSVRGFLLAIRWKRSGSHLGEMAVHIPLDVTDGSFAENFGDTVVN